MEKQELHRLFKCYLEREASKDEVRQLLKHFRLESGSELLKEMILQEMETSIVPDNVIDISEERMYNRVENLINLRIDADQNGPTIPFYKTARFKAFVSIAATAIFICVLFFYKQSSSVEIKIVHAAYGKQIEIQLPDSSKVWLNAGATLEYPTAFKGKQRLVTLKDGEAFFEVVHDSVKSFIINANGTKVNVLGTSFEISDLNKDADTKVTVRTGKVGVLQTEVRQDATFLLPGERATINKRTHQVLKTKVDTADIAAWLHERLLFTDEPIAEALARMERHYNVHFTIENDAILSERITMRLNQQPLDNVLAAISFSNHLKFKKINEKSVLVNK